MIRLLSWTWAPVPLPSVRNVSSLSHLVMVFFLLEKASKLCRNRAETCCAAFTMCFSTISQMICGKPRVYNRGLVLARLQMQLQDVGPLKLPWSDCMLGPGQKVTASWFFNIVNLWTWNATCHNCHGATVGILSYFILSFWGYLSTRIQWIRSQLISPSRSLASGMVTSASGDPG